MAELVSVREFARRVGCSDVAVHKAIKTQKIVKGYIFDKNGKGKIDPEVAAQEWGKNFDPTYTSNPKLKETLANEPSHSIAQPSGSSIAEAKRAQAIIKAKLLELEFKEKSGNLVDKANVYRSLFEAGQEIRSSIMAVPDRIVDVLMASNSRNEAHTILTQALIEALSSITEMEDKEIIK